MHRLFLILFSCFLCANTSIAQATDKNRFLFDDYQEALILYKDGRQYTAPVNFDFLEGHYLFIDSKDKQAKQFAEPHLIALLRIGKRSFLLENKGTTEVLQAEPLFQVTYSGKLRTAPKNLTYGGTTQTAAVDTYAGYSGGGMLSTKQQANNKVVAGINKVYECKIGNRTKRFYNQKTFLKAIPKQHREEMEEYITKNEINFENLQQVFDLYKYVNSTYYAK